MAILVTEKTKVLVQGITGKEGAKVTLQMKNYSTKVLAGVTPGKGGQEVHGVPVYNSVKEAIANHPGINTSLISVPNFAVLQAIKEATEAKIPLINVFTEHVPIQDSAKAIALARQHSVIARNKVTSQSLFLQNQDSHGLHSDGSPRNDNQKITIVGPSSMGIISPGIGKVGQIGGEDPRGVFTKGSIGVVSKSGGMSSEVSWILTQAGMGQSTVIGIGGDILEGSSFADLLIEFEEDPQTQAVVLFGEIGGTYEEDAAQLIKEGKFTKKIVAFVSGLFAENLPSGTKLGHAGAIVYGDKGSYKSKIRSLEQAGVIIAKTPDEIPQLLRP